LAELHLLPPAARIHGGDAVAGAVDVIHVLEGKSLDSAQYGKSLRPAAARSTVIATEADRCGVFAELLEAHCEALPDGQDEFG
jgi:hypothetical protein